jgi:hypothetical protein
MIEAFSFELAPDLKVALDKLTQRSMGSDNAPAVSYYSPLHPTLYIISVHLPL